MKSHKALYTYIHNYGYYNPSVRITAYLHTPLMLCALILHLSGGTRTTYFLKNFFISFTIRVFDRNLLRKNPRRNIFLSYFVLMPDLGYESRLLRLISQHTTY